MPKSLRFLHFTHANYNFEAPETIRPSIEGTIQLRQDFYFNIIDQWYI